MASTPSGPTTPPPVDGTTVYAGSLAPGAPGWVPPAERAPEPSPPPEPRRTRWRKWLRWTSWGLASALALLILIVAWLAITAPLSRSLQPIAPPNISLLASNGKLIARTGAIIEPPVTVTALPVHVPQAFLAIEDRRFYSHWGIDPRGIARAMWHNLRAGRAREGGSTITQQLAKGVFLNSDRTAGRKLREALIAFWLEAWLTKDEILERYLSNAYFGDNVYGLRAASLHYFNRRPEKLTIPQAAMLAGLLKAPSRLAPTTNLAGARERAKLVTRAMVAAGYISTQEEAALPVARLDVRPLRPPSSGTYFADWVLPQARDRAGAVYGEQQIVTTLDARLQRIAEESARAAPLGGAQIAMVAMRPDGTVVAMVGGRNYKASSFNRATQARRQPGSTFKLFVYLAALEAGMTPDDLIDDSPITTGSYRPANHGNHYRGTITLRQAFSSSSNVAAVRLAQKVGVDNVIRIARRLGITAPLNEDLSLALGTSEIPLVELAQAYASIASGTYPVRAHGLPQEEQSWLASLFDRPKAYPADELRMMRELLSSVANGGTGRAAALRTSTFGKTGTTQDSRDALFVGYAGGLVTAVWIGNDDNSPLPRGASGGGVPARVWRSFMVRAINEPQVREDAPRNTLDIDVMNAVANVTVATDVGAINASVSRDGVNFDVDLQPMPGERRVAPDTTEAEPQPVPPPRLSEPPN